MRNRNKGLLLSYGYFVLNTIIGIFMSAFVIRTIGKTNYGVYQSMTAFLSYLVLLEFGTGTIMARNISLCQKDNKDEVNKNVSTIWSLTVVLSVIIALVAIVFWLLIDNIYSKSMTQEQIILGKKLFLLAAWNLIFGFLTNTLNGLVLGYEYYTFEKLVAIIRLLLRTILVFVALSIRPDVLLVVLIDFAMGLLALLATAGLCLFKIKAKLVFRYFDKSVFKQITPLAFAMLLQTIVNTANGSVDKFCISILMTPEDVSIYSISMAMFSMFSSIATLPVTMFMPQIAKNMKSGMVGRELTESLVQPCRMNVLITGAVAFGFTCVGQQFLEIIYGLEYRESWLYAIIVILPMFVNMTNAVVINVIDVMNKRHVRSMILMITTTLNIVLTIVGIKYVGMIGAAVATAISLLGQTILLNLFYQKKIGLCVLYLFVQSYKGILVPYLIALTCAWPIRYIINNVIAQFLISGVAFIIVFGIVYIVFGMNTEEKNKYTLIKQRLFKKSFN